MSRIFESPAELIKRVPAATALVLSMGAVAGAIWVFSGDRDAVINGWAMVLGAEIGAIIAVLSWLAVSAAFARWLKMDIDIVRRADAITYLAFLFSFLKVGNLIVQTRALSLLTAAIVILMFIGAKLVEIAWFKLKLKRGFRICVTVALSIFMCAFVLRSAWRYGFAGKGEYWKDREVYQTKWPDSPPAFDGVGAKRVYVNRMGRWRPATRMESPALYRAAFNVTRPSVLTLGFIADKPEARDVRVSIRINQQEVAKDVVRTADDWVDKSWPVGVGHVEIRMSPDEGIFFVSDPSVTNGGDRPNVLLIVIDTLRADHLSSYGYPRKTSPRIDDLAKEGTLFENHFTPSTWSTGAVASLFTGLYPTQHGCVDFGGLVLPKELNTFAEYLKNSGYRTVGISGNPLLTEKWGFGQGFDYFDETCFNSLYWRSGECMTARGLADAGDGRPELLYLQYMDDHAPYNAPSPEWMSFRGWPFKRNPGTVMRVLTNRYDEKIHYCDRQIGRLIDGLRAKGWLDNAYIIITADHGEELGDHGRVTHGFTVYDEVIHVPLIIIGPGVPKDRRIEGITSAVDILPTILAAAGLGAPPDLMGHNLLTDPPPTREFAFADILEQTAIRSLQWKLIANSNKRRMELYDMKNDPSESNNVAALHPDARKELERQMQEYIKEIGKIKPPFAHALAVGEAAMRRRLRTLGYVK